jgi:hypothetical protein
MPEFLRTINIEIDWVDDTSFEIRGALNDNVHTVEARLLISFPDYVIREAAGEITRMPYPGFCQGGYAVLSKFVGERISRGFRKRAGEILGGAASCNHLHTLVNDMAACAFQMNYMAAKRRPEAVEAMRQTSDDPARRRDMVLGWMPQLRNSCFVFSESSDELFQLASREKRDESATSD